MTATDLRSATGFDQAWTRRAADEARERGEPGWALEQRGAAAAQAAALTFPSRTDELWRRTDFGSLQAAIEALDPFTAPPRARGIDDLPGAILERLAGEREGCALVVQRGADTVYEQLPAQLERQGVVVGALDRALRTHGERLRPHLGALIESGQDWYTALSAAVHRGGAFVWVPDGVEAALPIRLFQWLDGAGTLAAPRTVIVLGAGARATVIEEQLSETAEGPALHLGGTEVFVGEGAKLLFASHQEWGRHVYHYGNARARVARDAELQWVQTVLGARIAKIHAYFDLTGPGAQAFVHGFMFGDARQHFHLHTLQRHLADHGTSDLLIKCCLRDRARSVYQGLIQVAEGAQRTDAYQANRNLLLSDLARADSIPGLEILANDVRCTHGATIGSVEPEQMNYLMSRGLPRNEAQRLIVEGFFAPVLDRIPLEAMREQLRAAIQRKIG